MGAERIGAPMPEESLVARLREKIACAFGRHDRYPVKVNIMCGARPSLGIEARDYSVTGACCRNCGRVWTRWADGSPRFVRRSTREEMQADREWLKSRALSPSTKDETK